MLDVFFCRHDRLPVEINRGVTSQRCDKESFNRFVNNHLAGRRRIGCYTPTPGTSLSRWGCIDIDGGDGHKNGLEDVEAALVDIMSRCKGPVYLETSKSGEGFHIWFFFSQPTPAKRIREELYRCVGKWGCEVFPKQDHLPEGGLGNQVWLPFFGGATICGPSFEDVAWGDELQYYSLPVAKKPEPKKSAKKTKFKFDVAKETITADKAREMLSHVDPDLDRADWFRLLCVLHDFVEDKEEAKEVAREWSQQGDLWIEHHFKKDWDSIKGRSFGGAGLGSLIKYARDGGWTGQVRDTDSKGNAIIADGDETTIARDILERLDSGDGGEVLMICGEIRKYDPTIGVWHVISKVEIENMALAYHGRETGNGICKVTYRKASGVTKSVVSWILGRGAIDAAGWGLTFRNGFLDSERGLVPIHRKQFSLRYVDVDFDPTLKPPKVWTGFIARAFAGADDAEERAQALQQFTGACLVGKAPAYCRACLLYGVAGSGKSTFIEAVSHMFGNDISHVAPQDFRLLEARAGLAGKKLNVETDMPGGRFADTGGFKKLIDGEITRARQVYKESFDFKPQCGFLFASNSLPSSEDASDGFFRRWLIIGFDNAISHKDRDSSFRDRLSKSVKEDSWMYAWAWRGWLDLQKQGHYTLPSSHTQHIEGWREANDPIYDWLTSACEVASVADIESESSEWMSSSDCYQHYRKWSSRYGVKVYGPKTFAQQIKSLGVISRRRSQGIQYCLKMIN